MVLVAVPALGIVAVVAALLVPGANDGHRASTRPRSGCQANEACPPTTVATHPAPDITAVAPAPAPAPGSRDTLKPVLHGLLDRQGPPPAEFVGTATHGWVVQAFWADLQPTPAGPISNDNVIDRALTAVRQLNGKDPHLGLGLKLRVYAGIHAPDWAKNLGGAPLAASSPQSGQQGTIGRFWTPAFGKAYGDLMDKLAARYDAVPEIREVVISRCTTIFAEPFIRNRGDRQETADLLAAGFTVAADDICHRQQIDAHRVWRETRSDLELNPYQNITARGRAGRDEAFTEDKMRYCRSTLGRRCVLENNSLGYPTRYPEMYAAMTQLGPPIAFQTATPKKVGDLGQALREAAELGAASVELPVSYKQLAPSDLTAADAALRNNPG